MRANARDLGMTLNAYLNAVALRQDLPRPSRKASVDPKASGKVLAQASRLADLFEAIAKRSAGQPLEELMANCGRELSEIRTLLMLIARRQP